MKTTVEKWMEADGENRRLYAQETLIVDVAENLLEMMEERGVSKADLAKKLGTSKAYVTQLFRGSRNITLRTLSDIALALNLEPKIQFESHNPKKDHPLAGETKNSLIDCPNNSDKLRSNIKP